MREYAQQHNRAFEWLSVAVNCGELDAVRYGAEEFVRGAKMFGWDGLRFDDHFTVESCWDGGINFEGDVMDRGGDFEALSARNNQLFIDIVKAHDPNTLIGYNYAATYDMRGIRYPEAYAVTAKDGQCVMEEWSGMWPATLGTWGNIADKLQEENSRIIGLGGISGMFNFDTKNPDNVAVQRWTAALYFAAQSHYYNTPRTADVARYARFMLRYGGVLYDAKTQCVPDGTRFFHVTTERPCIWKPLIHEQQLSDTSRQMTLSIVNMDPAAMVNMAPIRPAPLTNTTVAFTAPTGENREGLAARSGREGTMPSEVHATESNGKATINLPSIACWNLLVVELVKA